MGHDHRMISAYYVPPYRMKPKSSLNPSFPILLAQVQAKQYIYVGDPGSNTSCFKILVIRC